jgi:hypothetical protein
MMFIAIENMGSAYGYKQANTSNKGPGTVRKPFQQKAYDKMKAEQYEARQAVASVLGFNPREDSSEGKGDENIFFAARTFAERNPDTCRYGVSGSLRSMFKRAAFECQNARGLTFDTLVFVGHGNTGLMCVGLGCSPVNELREAKGKHKAVAAAMKLDERMINVKNTESWSALFEEHKGCFSPDRQYGTFHVVFAGCSTGNQSETSYKFLTHVVAETLAEVFNCPVNGYGPDNEITNQEILEILGKINDIKSSTIGDSGTYDLETGVGLEWVKKRP